MGVMIIGGDNIAMINGNLSKSGFFVVKHVSGRKNSHKFVHIPQNTELVLVFVDFVNHKLCEHIKKESKKLGIRTVYSKRAWSCVESLLEQ